MVWYHGTFKCGHEGRVNITGPMKYRPWKVEKAFNGYCPKCAEKNRQKEIEEINKKTAQKSKEMGLPELHGTPKQIAWANSLRLNLIDKFEEFASRKKYSQEVKNATKDGLDYILHNRIEAKWYIDARYYIKDDDFIVKTIREYLNETKRWDDYK